MARGSVNYNPAGTTPLATETDASSNLMQVGIIGEPGTNNNAFGVQADTEATGNGSLIAIVKRLRTLLNGGLPAALVSGRLDVNVGATVTPANVALDASVGTTNTEIGGLTETAPGTDTASSGLNGRLQRIAQRLTSLIAQVPATLGQKTMANSLAVVLASDQSNITVVLPVATSGTPFTATATAGGAVVTVIAANSSRKFLEIINDSDTTVYLSPVNTVTNTGTNSGYVLYGRTPKTLNGYTGALYAIAISTAAANAVIRGTEYA